MQQDLQLLNTLAYHGIKLFPDGDKLHCYAPPGLLTKELRDSIARHKPKIIHRLRDYQDFQRWTDSGSRKESKEQLQSTAGSQAMQMPPAPELFDLHAEAILDPSIQPAEAKAGASFDDAREVLLTGASGFLGAYLLRDILNAAQARVHCLVRCCSPADGEAKIKKNLRKYGIWKEEFASRIVPVPGDLAQPLLGAGAEAFDRLCHVIDTVYHNGAVVNFIYSYPTLRDANVRGTEEVIRLACRNHRKPLHFVSTVGVFPLTKSRGAAILESDAPADPSALSGGYPQTKWVAERLVACAADHGLPARIYRPGFVTGDSTTGIANTDDFLSRMIKGCIQLGSAPDSDAMIEMVPVDYVSQAIVHLSRQPELSSRVFHLAGHNYVAANELFRIIASLGYQIKEVSYADWKNALLEDAKTVASNALYPLLAGFADGPPLQMPLFDDRFTREGLREAHIGCPKIDTQLVSTYLEYFKACGFLTSPAV